MKKWQLGILLGGIACSCAAFLLFDFRIAASNTSSEKNIATTRIGDRLPAAMQRREKINLVLIGEGPLITALQKAVEAKMNSAGIGDIELVEEIARIYQGPVLVLKVAKPSSFWTPFFATSQFTIEAGYSSNGDTNFMRQTPVTLQIRGDLALLMYGEYKVSDRSWGIISRPGYHQILADYLAREIVTTLKDLYRVSISGVPV
ncbi:MAG TPA: hypothetical protein VK206_11265 [Anaerolineales bacterium]|nr:hypothetical protein [Anaerolineales bacterium]HLO32250.1 hypothetical protein [Anaerolineales bacterium]